MAVVNLVFQQPPGSTQLVFGAGVEVPRRFADLAATLPPPTFTALAATFRLADIAAILPAPTFAASVAHKFYAALAANLSAPTFAASATYDIAVARPTVGQRAARWQMAQESEFGPAIRQQNSVQRPVGFGNPWRKRRGLGSSIEDLLPHALQAIGLPLIPQFRDAQALARATVDRFQDIAELHDQLSGRFGLARSLRAGSLLKFDSGDRASELMREASWQEAQRLEAVGLTERVDAFAFLEIRQVGRYQEAVPPQPRSGSTGGGETIYPPPEIPPYSTITVAVRTVYIVLNNVTLHRVADNTPVPAYSMTLSLDADSWTWGFEAELPETAQALVEPTSGPVELRASVNGTEFRVLAEDIARERSFGQSRIRVSGRGRNAVLASPYAPVLNFANGEERTIEQLANDVLTINGVSLGWDINWYLTNWDVPAGCFSCQGTWIEALSAIVGAGGGYLIPHPSAMSFRAVHRYPVAPWEWDTVQPHFVLPASAVARESLRWVEKPAYNRVFVSGQQAGVLGQVTRSGTAGDVLAPMVVDSLITAAAAARQRGLAVLADTGRQIEVDLRLPVLADTGVIEPGSFVRYQDGDLARIGLVRATKVEVGLPEVWQTIGVQAYA